jgi:asparagine synthase (glutamine-hydrolysing)
MCGIAGVWGRTDEDLTRRMMSKMACRGPDAEGVFLHPKSGGSLGHRRLSIMDPVSGDQPLYNEDRTLAIVANGEIYNFPRLRERLSARHAFRTRNDSEAILHLYEEKGAAVAEGLDGMFAFAIADGDDLYLARDPIGIKPLYYGERDGDLVFASEMKALAGVAEDVKEFPPGCWYHTKTGFRSYYAAPDRTPEIMPLSRRLEVVRETLERAVSKRLMSDVPLGAFLSGGVDSSVIAALARRNLEELHTFAVGIEGSSDLDAARVVARHIGSRHHERCITPAEALEKLPEIIYRLESFDQDLVRSAVPCYFASRLAAREVKVILTGEGADELFAGYKYYRGVSDARALHAELRRSVMSLHNINLQRVDRLTMAHSIEGRVPFLDVEMIEVAQTIPPSLKLRRDEEGRFVEKWILRKATEDLLPREIVWRAKEQFDEGSGIVDVLSVGMEGKMSRKEAEGYSRRFPEARLRSVEECLYHRIFREVFPDSDAMQGAVGRWAERPDFIPGVCAS